MLAQSFQSAADLGITEPQKEALMKTLVLLETGKLQLVTDNMESDVERPDRKFDGLFNMQSWAGKHDCGTVCCIGGTAEIIGNVTFGSDYGRCISPLALDRLFNPLMLHRLWKNITPSQAATALRSYLTTGDAKWHEAVS